MKNCIALIIALMFCLSAYAQTELETQEKNRRFRHKPGSFREYDLMNNSPSQYSTNRVHGTYDFDYGVKNHADAKNNYTSDLDEKAWFNFLYNDLESSSKSIDDRAGQVRVLDGSAFRVTDESDTSLYLGYLFEKYDSDQVEFRNEYRYSVVYESDFASYVYVIYADSTSGNQLSDTVSVTYSRYTPGSNELEEYRQWKSVNGELLLHRERHTPFTLELRNEYCDYILRSTEFRYEYFASYESINEEEYYLSAYSIILFEDNVIENFNYSFYENGDTLDTYFLKRIDFKTVFLKSETFDKLGNIYLGYILDSEFDDNDQLILREIQQFDPNQGGYKITNYQKYIYNEVNQLIEEEIGTEDSSVKYEYSWENDTIASSIESSWDINWIPEFKKEFGYLKDTTLIDTYAWNGSDWVLDGSEFYLYFEISDEQYEVHGEGIIGQPNYNMLDTLVNYGYLYRDIKERSYRWNGAGYQLVYFRNFLYGCDYIVDEIVEWNSGIKREFFLDHPINSTLFYTGQAQYRLDQFDTPENTTWNLEYLFGDYYIEVNDMIVHNGNEDYDIIEGGDKTEYIRDVKDNAIAIKSYKTDDTDPADGIDWWQWEEKNYVYDANSNLIEYTLQNRDNSIDPFSFRDKEMLFYTNGLNSLKVKGDFNGITFTPTDSIHYLYDTNENLVEEVGYTYDGSDIVDGYRQTYFYVDGDYNSLCGLSFEGDTMIVEDGLEISAVTALESPMYEWYDAEQEIISTTSNVIIDLPGIYYLKVTGGGCRVEDSLKIWQQCEVTIQGQSVYTGQEIMLAAEMIEVGAEIEYNWYNDSGDEIGKGSSYVANSAGNYIVNAIGEYCAGRSTHEIRTITSTDNIPSLQRVHVFPNPSSDYINISFPKREGGQLRISILDLSGRIQKSLITNSIQESLRISVEQIPPGVYLIKYEVDGQMQYSKVIIN